MRVQSHALPVRVVVDVVGARAEEFSVDGGREAGLALHGASGHGLVLACRQPERSYARPGEWGFRCTYYDCERGAPRMTTCRESEILREKG